MTGSLYKITLQSEMVAAFPPKCAVIVGEPNLRELIRVLRHCVKCAQSHSTQYDTLNCLYLVVAEALYKQYAPLVFNGDGTPVLNANGRQERQAMPAEPEYPGEGPTYDMMNVENNATIRDTWERKNMFYIEDKHMNRALCKLFLSLVSVEIQRTFEEEMMANPNMKFKDMADNFWATYGTVTEEEVKDNKDRLTTAWQPHQGFEALVAQIETCLVYSHFARKLIPDGELIDAFLICIKKTGCYQTGYDRWELLPAAQKKVWADTKFWWKKEYLRVKPTVSARQAGYGMNAAEEAAEDAQYNQSVASFASGHAASQGSIANLTATNAAQQQQITALQAQLQSANNVAQVMYAPPVQQPMMNVMPMQQQQGRGRGGRYGGRGGGRGRGRTSQGWQGAWGQLQQQPNTIQPNMNFGTGGAQQKTPYRIFDNWNYCHTCGGHISDDHTSATCMMPGPHHNCNATRQNMMSGTTRGMHKTVMPAQCGREARRGPQSPPTQGYLSWKASGFQGTRGQHEAQFKGQRQQRQQQQPAYPQANMMAPMMMPSQMAQQFITPQMMMPAPAQMPMMQQQPMQQQQMMAPPQQMMAPMMQSYPAAQQQQPGGQQAGQQQQYAGFGVGTQMGKYF
jgi:hypothetical protein